MPKPYVSRSIISRHGTNSVAPPPGPIRSIKQGDSLDERMVFAIANNDLETINQLLPEFMAKPFTGARKRILEGIKNAN